MVLLTTASCTLIDDDLSVCRQQYKLNYEMRLVTNINLELEEELTALNDSAVKRAIREEMADIFSDHAHDVDLSFYRLPDDQRAYYRNEVIDNNRQSFSFYLPKESYQHLSVANIKNATNVSLIDTLSSVSSRLESEHSDTIDSQTTGLFSARLLMEVQDSVDQEFNVSLYMVNSAVALVIDTIGQTVNAIDVNVADMACGFALCDSVFDFSRSQTVRAQQIAIPQQAPRKGKSQKMTAAKEQVRYTCYTSVNFPSDSVPKADGSYWTMRVYVSLTDGTITENVLSINSQLRAGDLKVIKTKLGDKGVITPIATTEVGATVTLDWKPGGSHDIEI